MAAIALFALIALVTGQRFGMGRQQPGESQALSASIPRAPNINNMTPRQITDRLFEMVITLHEAGLTDSVRYMAQTMAIPAFQMHDSLDLDLRYDLGRIAEVSGELQIAGAQADTILRIQPTHLLGLVLSANLARRAGDAAALKSLNSRLLGAEKSELAQNRREYLIHREDIERALSAARGGGE